MSFIRRMQWLVFGGVWLVYASTYLLRKPLGVIKVGMAKELGLSRSRLGLLDTALLLPYALAQALGGATADRMGPRLTAAASLAVAGTVATAIGAWNGFAGPMLLLALCGAAQGPAWPACCKCLAAWFPDRTLNTIFGLMSTSAYAGGAAATGLAVWLQAAYGWRLVYLPMGAAVLALSLLAWMSMRLPTDFGIVVPGKEHPSVQTGPSSRPRSSLFELWRLPLVAEMAVAVLCLKLVRYTVYLWLPTYLIQALGLNAATVGILSAVFDAGGVVGSALLGLAADRHSSLFHTWLAVVVSALAFILFLVTAAWGPLYNAMLLLLAGACICGPDALLGGSLAVAAGERDGRGAGAAVAGLVNGFGSLGAVLEGPLVGCVTDAYGWEAMLLLVVALLSIGSFCVLKALLLQRRQSVLVTGSLLANMD